MRGVMGGWGVDGGRGVVYLLRFDQCMVKAGTLLRIHALKSEVKGKIFINFTLVTVLLVTCINLECSA